MFLELFFKIYCNKLNEKSPRNNQVIGKIIFQIKKIFFKGIKSYIGGTDGQKQL
uniref:Uncharacterized protein n=1 Tax=uncultured delta proteobacterium HF0130_19C20 TaxID=710828 RepID=E0XT58_9DELT|nr:hypothetical protein [uncultured delta proteobacterium HF0130_19C20]